MNAASKGTLRGCRDAAIVAFLLGCGLRRSEVVGLRLDQLQSREGRWVIVDLVGKGGRIRTVPVPSWCKELVDSWLRNSSVIDGKIFRRVVKNRVAQDSSVTADVVWYAVKRCAKSRLITGIQAATNLDGGAIRLREVVSSNDRFDVCHADLCGGPLRGTALPFANLAQGR